MFQNFFKKSAAVKIGIPRKGSQTNKSLSPVTMHEAFASTANSRNLLSLGSRQSVMISVGENIRSFVATKLITKNLSSSHTKYLSNFDWNNTSINASKTFSEHAIEPSSTSITILSMIFYFIASQIYRK